MKKNSLNIPANVYAALIFLSGLIDYVPLLIIGIYVYTKEDDDYLKKSVVKAITFTIIMASINACIFSLGNFLSIIHGFILNFDSNAPKIVLPLQLDTILTNTSYLVSRVGYLYFAYKAYNPQATVKSKNKTAYDNSSEETIPSDINQNYQNPQFSDQYQQFNTFSQETPPNQPIPRTHEYYPQAGINNNNYNNPSINPEYNNPNPDKYFERFQEPPFNGNQYGDKPYRNKRNPPRKY